MWQKFLSKWFKATDWCLAERVGLQITTSVTIVSALWTNHVPPTKWSQTLPVYSVQNSTTRWYSSMSSNTKLMPKPLLNFLYRLTFDKCCNSIYALSHQPVLHPNPTDNIHVGYCTVVKRTQPCRIKLVPLHILSTSIKKLHRVRAQRHTTCSWNCS